jgi:hypothetical protein
MGVTERIRQLRREIVALEQSDHPDREQERREAYLEALEQERRGAERTVSGTPSRQRTRTYPRRNQADGIPPGRQNRAESALELDAQVAHI